MLDRAITIIHWRPATSQVLSGTSYFLSLIFPPSHGRYYFHFMHKENWGWWSYVTYPNHKAGKLASPGCIASKAPPHQSPKQVEQQHHKMEQRLAARQQPPRSMAKPSWAPADIIRRLLCRLLVIAWRDYYNHIAYNYNSSWRHNCCYPHPLRGPQLRRSQGGKDYRYWNKKCCGNPSLRLKEKRLHYCNSINLTDFSPK